MEEEKEGRRVEGEEDIRGKEGRRKEGRRKEGGEEGKAGKRTIIITYHPDDPAKYRDALNGLNQIGLDLFDLTFPSSVWLLGHPRNPPELKNHGTPFPSSVIVSIRFSSKVPFFFVHSSSRVIIAMIGGMETAPVIIRYSSAEFSRRSLRLLCQGSIPFWF